MYIKRLAEKLVRKALLLFEILSFEVYCSQIATPRLNDMGSRLLSVSTIRRVGDSPYQRYAESATLRIVESGSRFSNMNISENSCRLLRKKNISGVAYYAKKFYTLSPSTLKNCKRYRLVC
jgi:hypothetical protein